MTTNKSSILPPPPHVPILNKRFFLITALAILTAASVSAQTTAALVRTLGGASKAKADGSAVTLTANVTLGRTALVVPAGVTLDLTRDGARLILGNNAVLTVNGTVNAKEGSINIDSAATSPATINGSGTINLKSKGQLLIIDNGQKKLIIDGVTLVGLPDNNTPLVFIGGGGELVLKSGAITSNNNAKVDGWWCGGGVNVNEQGTFTMSGGTISGNHSNGGGGGVGVQGTFIMSGGTISGNSGPWGGGGVAVFGDDGTFVMSGGVISGNRAKDSDGQGGGVWLDRGSFFTLEGGTIYGSSEGTNANIAQSNAALMVRNDRNNVTAKWGTSGTYTRGGVPQTGGSNIANTNDTLIAIPAR